MWVFLSPFGGQIYGDALPSQWHAYEMFVGTFGAALLGFITTAVPEWTDSKRLKGKAIWILVYLWAVGRISSFISFDGVGLIGGIADLSWELFLVGYVANLSWKLRTDRLLIFVFWLMVWASCLLGVRIGFATNSFELANRSLLLLGFAFLGLLGAALARITVPVTNLVLDPSELTSPYRPHPGRLNLTTGLVLIVIICEILELSSAVSAYIYIAAGAAFLDRVGEAFIGREALQSEILLLSGSSAFTGIGLIMYGATNLGAPWNEYTGIHIAFMGGLGLGVYAVFCIAGLLHTNQPLGIPKLAKLGAVVLVISVFLRVAPDFGYNLPGPLHGIAAYSWSAAFLMWLYAYWPFMRQLDR